MVARQGRHLGAALDLEHAHGVGALQSAIGWRIVWRKLGEVERLAVVRGDEGEAILEHGHHAEPEQIDLDDLHVGAIFLVPLDDGAARHGSRFDGHDGIELAGADDHAAGVLSEMARQVLHALAQLDVLGDAAMLDVEARRRESCGRANRLCPSTPRR